jgi:hypothetical protein
MSTPRPSSDRDNAGTFEGTSSRDVSGEGTLKGTFLSDDRRWAKLRDRLFSAVALAAIFTMALTSYLTVRTNAAVSELNRRQVELVQIQNNAQLCNQRDMLSAVKKIGERLGLPVDDIPLPDTEGLDCPT